MSQCKNYLKQQHENNINLACRKYPIINRDSLKKHEKLLYDEPYLPKYLLYELNPLHYHENLKEKGLYDDYKKQFFKHAPMEADEEAQEFYEWVQKHKEYKDLLHTNNHIKLTNLLDMLNQLQKNILKDFIDKGYVEKQ